MKNITATIAAISTPPGKGGVAVIRISGDTAREIAEQVFFPKGKNGLDRHCARLQIYGDIKRDGRIIDDGCATYFPAPNSYTGEDVVEISCHGGILISRAVLEAVLAAGAVMAEAGEFTKRAFINGKISMSDAEGIGLLLEAEGEGQLKLSSNGARQSLNLKINQIHKGLVTLLGSMLARVDYPDEDLGDFTRDEEIAAIEELRLKISALLSTYKTGSVVKEGIKACICGKPNAGKSTLYNRLCGEDSAIVTDIPGTTRDILERTVPMGDLLLRLSDTAGIREGGEIDTVEKIGIERSRQRAKESALILSLFDAASPLNSEDLELIEFIGACGGEKIALLTKCDIASEKSVLQNEKILSEHFSKIIRISAKDESLDGWLAELSGAIYELFTDDKLNIGDDAIIYSPSQYGILTRAMTSLDAAMEALRIGLPEDLAASDVEAALKAISELDGKGISEEIVADIFARFCVGK